ncbi:NAD(P)/FAD-dependent oxidoreductase [Sneathiella sp.]|uniref:NAD(P)/FAD-dependent oxidoreductase n=1 Tax=Sneathiella sp. TaxID=1964365 RepID=UPI002FDFB91E
MSGDTSYDIAVIGAGIAGASIAAELAPKASVLLLEMESQPGYHTTGRSAAAFIDTYGPAPVRALTRASEPFYCNPPTGFTEHQLLTPRGILMVAREDQLALLEAEIIELSDAPDLRQVNAAEIEAAMPLLRKGYAKAGLVNNDVSDIDVHALHQGYLKMLRGSGGAIKLGTEVTALERKNGLWHIVTRDAVFTASRIVNAAGAWADDIGALAGASPIGLVPKRRTAMMIAAPAGMNPDPWPMVIDIAEEFYLKPDAGRLLISPADETPAPAGDVQPEELDIAICIDRIETAFDLSVRRIENKWAGLRSFVADKSPVCGFDDKAPDFFWLAGQGGYGIQSAPALAKLAASLVLGRDVPSYILDEGLKLSDIAPGRPGLTPVNQSEKSELTG